MSFGALVHEALWREIDRADHVAVRDALRALCALTSPTRSPHVRALEGSAYPKSYRLRAGRHRILFILMPDLGVIVFTTAFLKKRDSDYVAAVRRHDARVRSYE